MKEKIKSTEKCAFCIKHAIYLNTQQIPVCKDHKLDVLLALCCICGKELNIKQKKNSVYFNCPDCGEFNLKHVLKFNSNIKKDKIKKFKQNKLTEKKIQEARFFLRDVSEDKAFYGIDGTLLRNLDTTIHYLKDIEENVFKYHINKDKNDFYNWIKDVILDDKLAKNIKDHKNSKALYKTIKNRVDKLKKRIV
jgi:predicted RNA-binding Zn-ribbon protein involved in translation (DUF1610 family)